MFIKRAFFFLLLAISFLNENCRKNNADDETNKQITSYLVNQYQTSGTNACSNFAFSESSCISSADLVTTTCSAYELSRLKSQIEPIALRTDAIMDKFFSCWKNCNVLFNTQESMCNSGKFASNKDYRNSQRSGSTSSSGIWQLCMDPCTKGTDVTSGLSGTGANYPKSAY
jgi:hypothetical protein